VSWLGAEGDGATSLERLLGVHPDARAAVRDFYSSLWVEHLVDPALLELLRLRVAQIYQCPSELGIRYEAAGDIEDKVAQLSMWPTSSLFSDLERACLRMAEQFVLDAHGITDADTAAISAELGSPGLVAVTNAVALFDYLDRIRTVFEIRPESTEVVTVPSPSPTGPLY
jgi:alkylhydroperoxidase family enzyme